MPSPPRISRTAATAVVLRHSGIAIGLVALATLARWLLDPYLGNYHAYAMLYIAVAVIAWRTTTPLAIASLLVGWLTADFLFVPPRFDFIWHGDEPEFLVGTLTYFALAATSIIVPHAMRAVQRRAAESGERLAAMHANSTIGLTELALDGRWVNVNDAFCRIVGYTRDELLKLRFFDITFAEDLPRNRELMSQLAAGEIPSLRLEKRFVRKDGSPVWVDVNRGLIKDAAGQPLYIVGAIVDITARKQAEERLRESEGRFRSLAASVPVGIFRTDADGACVFVNESWMEISGMSAEEARGAGWAAALHPEDRAAVLENWSRAARNGEIFSAEYRLVHPSGRVTWVAGRSVPEDGESGATGYVGTITDITERKQAEAELARTTEHLETLLATAPLGFCDFDRELRYIRINDRLAEMNGIRAADHLGKTVAEIVPALLPTVQEITGRILATGQAVVGHEFSGETPAHPAVTRSWSESWWYPVRDGAGAITGFGVIVEDITERKRAEAELRESQRRLAAVLDATSAVVYQVDADSRFVLVNRPFEELFGITADVRGRTLYDVFPPDIAARFEANNRLVLAEGRAMEFDEVAPHPNGPHYYATVKAPLLIDGVPVGIVGVSTDITERKQAEAEVHFALAREQEARAAAETANRLKDEFLAIVSHEVRTPLNAITGWAHLLRSGKLSPQDAERGLETIERNTKLQATIINELLDTSRIISGKLQLDSKPVDLASVIESAVEVVRPASEAKSIQIDTKLDATAGLVLGDADRLQQVVWNLLSNAVKFTPQGGHVQVRLESDSTSVAIVVEDNGEGIASEFLPYVFDRFRQADATSTRSQGGLGLGLSIVRNLIEMQGGRVHARSRGKGHGSTFTVTLPHMAISDAPLESAIAACPGHAGKELPSRQTNAGRLDGLRVLVVDDELDARDVLSIALTDAGAQVNACCSSAEALAAIKEWKPDCLVSDIGMPGEDGYTLIKKVRALQAKEGRNIPALALTGYAGAEDRSRATEAGYQAHIAKPVSLSELISTIDQLAGRKETMI